MKITSSANITQIYLISTTFFVYALIIFICAPIWSFDFTALTNTVEFLQSVHYLDFRTEVVFNNILPLYLWNKIFYFVSPYYSISFLFSVAAFIRFFVFYYLFPYRLTIPIFFASSIFIDLNNCRYSLALSFSLLLLSSRLNKHLIAILSFPIHPLSSLIPLLLRPYKSKHFILLIPIIQFLSYICSIFYTRHFTLDNEPFPRITFVYYALSIILIYFWRAKLSPFFTSYLFLCYLPINFLVFGLSLNNAYYFRFADVLFQFVCLTILYVMRTQPPPYYKNSLPPLILYTVSCFSFVYGLILLGGNIWRFF